MCPQNLWSQQCPKAAIFWGAEFFGELNVGDIVVFEHEGKRLVKRIAAEGGDVVEHKGWRLIVPEGCFYVLGDNTLSAYDARYWEDPFVQCQNPLAILAV